MLTIGAIRAVFSIDFFFLRHVPLDLTSNQEILDTLRDQMPEGYSQRTSLDLALRRAAGLAVGMDVSPTAKPARARGRLPVKTFRGALSHI